MPLPIIPVAISLTGLALTGIKKGFDAISKNGEAKEIVQFAHENFNTTKEALGYEGKKLNEHLEKFARVKLDVFTTQIKTLVEVINKCKESGSTLDNKTFIFSPEEVKLLELAVSNSFEISTGIAKGVAGGVLGAMGAYGSVGLLASASTGAAIGSLGGVAATNATLAWLGGGTLASGGFGMAGGVAMLGGLAAAPLIAVAGFVMNSSAEKNLTEAHALSADTMTKIEQMLSGIESLKVIDTQIDELTSVIIGLTTRFDMAYKVLENKKPSPFDKVLGLFGINKYCKQKELEQLLIIGKNLKMALDVSLLNKDGNENMNFREEIERIVL